MARQTPSLTPRTRISRCRSEGRVVKNVELGTHTLFVAEITAAGTLDDLLLLPGYQARSNSQQCGDVQRAEDTGAKERRRCQYEEVQVPDVRVHL